MKVLALALLALLATGCASLAPTAVNPAVTVTVNDLKAITAAAGGDCTIPITAPTTATLHADCSPLDPTVTTVQVNGTTFQSCFNDAATVQIGTRVSAAAVGLQAQICANARIQAGVPAAPVAVTVPAVK
jgi:PBP1b-binding outer membrane lipoprotein LpoB